MEKLHGVEHTYNTINGRELFIADSLVMSQVLYPMRQLPKNCPKSLPIAGANKTKTVGPHSLDAWAYRTGIAKPQVFDWQTQPLDVYLTRCIEDTKNNEVVYDMLLAEMKDVAIPNGHKKGDWKTPMRMQMRNYFLIRKQAIDGVLFDEDLGWKLLSDLDKEMAEMEKELNPLFGEKPLCKSKQPPFPKKPFNQPFPYSAPFTQKGGLKKAVVTYLNKIGIPEQNHIEYIKSMIEVTEVEGNKIITNKIEELLPKHPSLLSGNSLNYGKKIGITDPQKLLVEIQRVMDGGEPIQLTEKVGLRDVDAVKQYLVNEGWKPTMWNFRNVTTDPQTKTQLPTKVTEQKIKDYIEEFRGHVYWPFILVELGYKSTSNVNPDSKSFMDKCKKNARNLLSSPTYKDQNGIQCPNLEDITGENSKKIIRFLSLKHRRSMLKSTDEKKKETHGLLNNLRPDGRISADVAGPTATTRKRHRGVVNIPAVGSVYGEEMRSLFIAPERYINVGADAASIEGYVASMYTIPLDGGIYAENVLTGKMHDLNAEAYSREAGFEIKRNKGKNITYAILYGASPTKIARMMSVDLATGKRVHQAFWETNIGLLKLKENLLGYWEKTGKKYIMALDGRKLFVRSPHSIINMLFQSAGSILLDWVLCFMDEMIFKEKLNAQRWIEMHDEAQFYQLEQDVIRYTFKASGAEELPLKNGTPDRKQDPLKPEKEKDGRLYSVPKYEDGEWVQYYSRVGELMDLGFQKASKYFKAPVTFRAEYMCGKNWAECH